MLVFLQSNIIFILIFAICASVAGTFLFAGPYKKLGCISCSFSSLILLFFLLSLNSPKQDEILSIIATILILFAAIIGVGIAMIDKIDYKNKIAK